MKETVLKAIEDNNLYSFIANHYWEMSKEELKDIILELNYALYEHGIKDSVIADELSDRWEDITDADDE